MSDAKNCNTIDERMAVRDLVGRWLVLRHCENQRLAARELGVTRMTINRWVRGETTPNDTQLERIRAEHDEAMGWSDDEIRQRAAAHFGVPEAWMEPGAPVPGERVRDEE